MEKSPSVDAGNKPTTAKETDVIDVIKTEYAQLHDLYIHTETMIFGVFNFYLTLLSAIVGAIVVLVQTNNANLTNALPSICGLLALSVLIGVIMQDSIVGKNIDLSIYMLAINRLKSRLFRQWPEELSNIYFLNVWANALPNSPNRSKRIDSVAALNRRFRWFLPLGTHQLFIAVMDSLALAALVIIAVQLLLGASASIPSLAIAGIIVVLVSFEIHVIYAQLKYQRGIKNIMTAEGQDDVKA